MIWVSLFFWDNPKPWILFFFFSGVQALQEHPVYLILRLGEREMKQEGRASILPPPLCPSEGGRKPCCCREGAWRWPSPGGRWSPACSGQLPSDRCPPDTRRQPAPIPAVGRRIRSCLVGVGKVCLDVWWMEGCSHPAGRCADDFPFALKN